MQDVCIDKIINLFNYFVVLLYHSVTSATFYVIYSTISRGRNWLTFVKSVVRKQILDKPRTDDPSPSVWKRLNHCVGGCIQPVQHPPPEDVQGPGCTRRELPTNLRAHDVLLVRFKWSASTVYHFCVYAENRLCIGGERKQWRRFGDVPGHPIREQGARRRDSKANNQARSWIRELLLSPAQDNVQLVTHFPRRIPYYSLQVSTTQQRRMGTSLTIQEEQCHWEYTRRNSACMHTGSRTKVHMVLASEGLFNLPFLSPCIISATVS